MFAFLIVVAVVSYILTFIFSAVSENGVGAPCFAFIGTGALALAVMLL